MKRSHKTKEYILALILGVGVIVKFCTGGLNALEVSKLLAVIFKGKVRPSCRLWVLSCYGI